MKASRQQRINFVHWTEIDCNFGTTAAICEMLLQSQNRETYHLPALPAEWKEVSVKGL